MKNKYENYAFFYVYTSLISKNINLWDVAEYDFFSGYQFYCPGW